MTYPVKMIVNIDAFGPPLLIILLVTNFILSIKILKHYKDNKGNLLRRFCIVIAVSSALCIILVIFLMIILLSGGFQFDMRT
jgi:hypothetical protein